MKLFESCPDEKQGCEDMKERKIKLRSIVYSSVGIFFALTMTGLMLISIPPTPSPLSEAPPLQGKEDPIDSETGELPEEHEYPGLNLNGYVLGDNPYHLGETELDGYLKAETFRIGRWNPMLYRNKVVLPVENPEDATANPETSTKQENASEEVEKVEPALLPTGKNPLTAEEEEEKTENTHSEINTGAGK